MKRTIALILAVLTVLASAVMAFADEPPMLIATHDPVKLPFKAYSLGGKLLDKAVKEEQAYTYTNWSNAAFSVDLYTIVVPEGTEAVKLSFDSEKLCYNYAFTGEGAASVTDADYLSGAVADENTQDGQISFTVPLDSKLVNYDGTTSPADGVIDFVQIQTPYDANWTSSVLFAITFKTEPVTAANIPLSSAMWHPMLNMLKQSHGLLKRTLPQAPETAISAPARPSPESRWSPSCGTWPVSPRLQKALKTSPTLLQTSGMQNL